MELLRRKIASASVTGIGSVVLRSALNLVLVPVLIKHVGLGSYGLFVLICGIIEVLAAMDFGLGATIVALVAGAKDEEKLQFLRAGHRIFVALVLATAVVVAFGFSALGEFIHLAQPDKLTLHMCFIPVAIEVCSSLYGLFYRAAVCSRCEYRIVNTVDAVSNLASILGALGIVLLGGGLVEIFWVRAVCAICRCAALFMLSSGMKLNQKPVKAVETRVWQRFKETGCYMALTQVSVNISHGLDSIIIGIFLPLEAVALYGLVFRCLSFVSQIGIKTGESVLPVFSAEQTRANRSEVKNTFLSVSSFTSLMTGTLLILVWVFRSEILSLIATTELRLGDFQLVLALAMAIVWTGAMQVPATAYLIASGQQRYLAISSLLAAVVNLVLSLALVQKLGVAGVLVGTLVPQFIQHQLGLIRRACECIGCSLLEYGARVHWRAFAGVVTGMLSTSFGLLLFGERLGYISIAFISIIAVMIAIGTWRVVGEESRLDVRRGC